MSSNAQKSKRLVFLLGKEHYSKEYLHMNLSYIYNTVKLSVSHPIRVHLGNNFPSSCTDIKDISNRCDRELVRTQKRILRCLLT
jgi:hypothetical protein